MYDDAKGHSATVPAKNEVSALYQDLVDECRDK